VRAPYHAWCYPTLPGPANMRVLVWDNPQPREGRQCRCAAVCNGRTHPNAERSETPDGAYRTTYGVVRSGAKFFVENSFDSLRVRWRGRRAAEMAQEVSSP